MENENSKTVFSHSQSSQGPYVGSSLCTMYGAHGICTRLYIGALDSSPPAPTIRFSTAPTAIEGILRHPL